MIKLYRSQFWVVQFMYRIALPLLNMYLCTMFVSIGALSTQWGGTWGLGMYWLLICMGVRTIIVSAGWRLRCGNVGTPSSIRHRVVHPVVLVLVGA